MPLYVHRLIQKNNLPDRGGVTDGDDTDEESEDRDTRDARPAKRRRVTAERSVNPDSANPAGPTINEPSVGSPSSEEMDVDDPPSGTEGHPIEIASSSCPGSDIDHDEVSTPFGIEDGDLPRIPLG